MHTIEYQIDFKEETETRADLTRPPESPPEPPIRTATGSFDGGEPIGGGLLNRLAELRDMQDPHTLELMQSAKIAKSLMSEETADRAKKDVHLRIFRMLREKLHGTLELHAEATAMHLNISRQCNEILDKVRGVLQKLQALDAGFIPFNAEEYLIKTPILQSVEGLQAFNERIAKKRVTDWKQNGEYINAAGFHMITLRPRHA